MLVRKFCQIATVGLLASALLLWLVKSSDSQGSCAIYKTFS